MKRVIFFLFFLSVIPATAQQLFLDKHTADKNVRIVVFLSLDCPISQKYIPVLKSIYEQYGKQAALSAIVPGKIKKSELETFVHDYAIAFPVSRDKKYKRVKSFNARVTPEVFVFDRTNALQYRGAIDNWFYDLGQYRIEASENYLIDSIESLLAGKAPGIRETDPIGCTIQAPR